MTNKSLGGDSDDGQVADDRQQWLAGQGGLVPAPGGTSGWIATGAFLEAAFGEFSVEETNVFVFEIVDLAQTKGLVAMAGSVEDHKVAERSPLGVARNNNKCVL